MKKNTAGQYAPSVTLVSAADGSAITTGASIYVTVDDGTPTAGSGTLAYSANRGWSYAPTQAETNGDKLTFRYAHASAVGGGVSATVYTSHPQTGDAFGRIGAAGAGLTGVPWNAAWDAEVESEVSDALNTYDPPTKAELDARTLPSASYFDPTTDEVANVATVGSVTGDIGGNVNGSVNSVTTPVELATDQAVNVTKVAGVAVAGVGDFKADVSDLLTTTAYTSSLPANFSLLAIDASGHVTDADSGGGSSLTKQDVRDEVDAALVAYDAIVPADLPTNFAALGINSSGHLSRVTLVDTTTVNTDMRGTDGAYTGTPPTAEAISTQVASDLAAAHGSGSWTTATGFATPTNVTDAATSVINHGDGVWATAVGFATPSNVTAAAQAVIDHGDGNWIGGGTAPSVDDIAARLLVNPANKLVTNADGSVNATVSGVDVDEAALASALIDAGVASEASVQAVGQAVASLSGTEIELTSPIDAESNITIRRARDYDADDGRAIEWVNVNGTWPDLTGATFTVLVGRPGQKIARYSFPGSIVTPAGAGQTVRLELTDEQTDILADDYAYEGKVTLVSGNVIDLPGVAGTFTLVRGFDDPEAS